ncbi:hypothetical protein G6F57_017819 [Rhizopus arrhizus]|nr:hypothetical protein G6F31_021941 [Rhizopus arrhizus]KAG1253472.1 hypothetical protein G6F65_017453 [Rhizopus arrhizus]KAG1387235.1 hypothetical protein G6F59_016494 [Rhizopus arrhizus]KAG1444432.1 hypothetical protein G6F57_017819 [Rhizopus arrhizus]
MTQVPRLHVGAAFPYFSSTNEYASHRRAKALALAGIGVPNLRTTTGRACSLRCSHDNAPPASPWRTVRGDPSIRRL